MDSTMLKARQNNKKMQADCLEEAFVFEDAAKGSNEDPWLMVNGR